MNLQTIKPVRILFIIFLIAMPFLLTPILQAGNSPVEKALPLEMFLTADGHLNLPQEGIPGSIDPAGYALVNEPGEAPRFAPTNIDESSSISTTCEDTAWDSRFFSDGVLIGVVHTLAWDGDNLYVGGRFNTAGRVVANNIAKWDGNRWSALGSGVDHQVRALVWSSGNLYAGGDFRTAGNVLADRIAKWDGSRWSALGSGIEGDAVVYSLAWDGNNLYAGGVFDTAGGNPANNIAKWDGSHWIALGSGIEGYAVVHSLAWDGSNLYAGGRFDAAGGISTNSIAKWDGSHWVALGSGMEIFGHEGIVYSLVWDGSALYAGGGFNTAGGNAVNNIAKWDGVHWSALGDGIDDNVYALAWDGSNLYAGVNYDFFTDPVPVKSIAKWDGSHWSDLGNGIEVGVSALAWDGSNLYAGGGFSIAGENPVNQIAKWNGSGWSALGRGGHSIDGIPSALVWDGSNLYIGGRFYTAGETATNNIAEWDGRDWAALGDGITGLQWDTYVYALAWDGSNLYAGGKFHTAGETPANNIAKWDGNSWSALGSGIDGEIYALAWDGSNLYAGGEFDTVGGVLVNNIAKWDGNSWSALGSGIEHSDSFSDVVRALVWGGNNLYVGGEFDIVGGIPANNIAKWNGSRWSVLGDGVSGDSGIPVFSLVWGGNNLYVGGRFSTAGKNPANSIAKWDGTNWSALGGGIDDGSDYVRALAWDGNNLYAGGDFDAVGGNPISRIARWDGNSWSALGSGVGSIVAAGGGIRFRVSELVWDGNGLYAGGFFIDAGGKPSHSIAYWRDIDVTCSYTPIIMQP